MLSSILNSQINIGNVKRFQAGSGSKSPVATKLNGLTQDMVSFKGDNKEISQQLSTLLQAGNVNEFNALKQKNPELRLNLRGIDLTDANLPGVDLTDADLTRANLIGVNLTGANLTGAKLDDATFTLSKLKELNQDNKAYINENYNIVYLDEANDIVVLQDKKAKPAILE